MKPSLSIFLIAIILLSCSRATTETNIENQIPSSSHYVGKWHFFMYVITVNGNTKGYVADHCQAKTNYQISTTGQVVAETYSNCNTHSIYYGSYNDKAKKLTLNYEGSTTVFDVEFSNNDLLLKEINVIDGVTYTFVNYFRRY